MPVEKIRYAHRFGIISSTYKEKLEKDIRKRHEDAQRTNDDRMK
jgi:hypothetical protein